jgi:hypothetical protein
LKLIKRRTLLCRLLFLEGVDLGHNSPVLTNHTRQLVRIHLPLSELKTIARSLKPL